MTNKNSNKRREQSQAASCSYHDVRKQQLEIINSNKKRKRGERKIMEKKSRGRASREGPSFKRAETRAGESWQSGASCAPRRD